MKSLICVLLLLTGLAAGCKLYEPDYGGGDALVVIYSPDHPPRIPSDPAMLLLAEVEGDQLRIKVRYGGGCNEHTFRLYWDGSIMESFPPQVNIRLGHDSHGDMCRALLEKDLAFNISTLKKRWAYEEMIVHLLPPDETDEAITLRVSQ